MFRSILRMVMLTLVKEICLNRSHRARGQVRLYRLQAELLYHQRGYPTHRRSLLILVLIVLLSI